MHLLINRVALFANVFLTTTSRSREKWGTGWRPHRALSWGTSGFGNHQKGTRPYTVIVPSVRTPPSMNTESPCLRLRVVSCVWNSTCPERIKPNSSVFSSNSCQPLPPPARHGMSHDCRPPLCELVNRSIRELCHSVLSKHRWPFRIMRRLLSFLDLNKFDTVVPRVDAICPSELKKGETCRAQFVR
jgi:hypothetical protein